MLSQRILRIYTPRPESIQTLPSHIQPLYVDLRTDLNIADIPTRGPWSIRALANYGKIYAKGGKGGIRAAGSGSAGDAQIRGGNGGDGRIRFDFLTTQSHGIVKPPPKNVTNYQGNVLVYHRNTVTGMWSLKSYLPRLSSMMFVGHGVALFGHLLAVSSDQGTAVTPKQAVFLIDIATLRNRTSLLPFRVLTPPGAVDEKFGWSLSMNNNTLVVAAFGSDLVRGIVYVYQSRNLLKDTARISSMTTISPVAGDYFGLNLQLLFPWLVVQLPELLDDRPPPSSRRSKGYLHLFKYNRNVSIAHSRVSCEYSNVTVNVTLNCTVHFHSADTFVEGDLDMILDITPAVDFKSIGVFTFHRIFTTTGRYNVNVSFQGFTVPGFDVLVTAAIVPVWSSFGCDTWSRSAGEMVTCTISCNLDAGEDIASKEFDVSVYRMDADKYPEERIDREWSALENTSTGWYKNLYSFRTVVDPLQQEYNLLRPSVFFINRSHYYFNFMLSEPGTFAVFVQYKTEALDFPNPAIVEATEPPIDAQVSDFSCPTDATLLRPVFCTFHLRGSKSTISGNRTTVGYLLNNTVVQVTIVNASNSSGIRVLQPITAWWSGEGRVVMYFNFSGVSSMPGMHLEKSYATAQFSAKYLGTSFRNQTSRVSRFASKRCNRFPALQQFIDLLNHKMPLGTQLMPPLGTKRSGH